MSSLPPRPPLSSTRSFSSDPPGRVVSLAVSRMMDSDQDDGGDWDGESCEYFSTLSAASHDEPQLFLSSEGWVIFDRGLHRGASSSSSSSADIEACLRREPPRTRSFGRIFEPDWGRLPQRGSMRSDLEDYSQENDSEGVELTETSLEANASLENSAFFFGSIMSTAKDQEPEEPVEADETGSAEYLSERNLIKSDKKLSSKTVVDDSVYAEVTKCLRWFGHGRKWTTLSIFLAWVGITFSILARQILSFVTLGKPMTIIPLYEPIDSVGLVDIELCFNETVAGQTGCSRVTLNPNKVDDTMYELARLFGLSSVVFGAFFTFFITTTVFWETIDLRPIGFGLLLTYFLQSFTMLIFDADICRAHHCNVGTGCIFCIIASVCWVGSCIATAKMEAFKIRATRRRKRRAKRRAKKALREAEMRAMKKRMYKKASTATQKTVSSAASDQGSLGLEEEGCGDWTGPTAC